MAGTAADLIRVADSQVGVQEDPPDSNHIPYWNDLGLPGDQGQPWCAAFVTWCMLTAGVPFPTLDTPHGYLYCPDAATWARATGHEVPVGQETTGDIVLFQWGNDEADHTGFFLSRNDDGTINTIEGNAALSDGNDGVGYHVRTDEEVFMYIRPPFTTEPVGPPTHIPVAKPHGPPDWTAIAEFIAACRKELLQEGSHGPAVGYLQSRLIVDGAFVPGMQDPVASQAIFGPKTRASVMIRQAHVGIRVDGIVGPQTWPHI